MNWLAWRQHRKQFMVAGIFLALFAALMIPTGLHYWHTYQHTLSTCSSTDTCSQVGGELFQGNLDGLILHLVPVAFLFIPIVLGLFWGVPFLAREYAEGTNKLVWTQSVSRKKWLTVKLIWIILGTAIIAGMFAALMTWWSKTNNAINLNRFHEIFFNTQGIAPVAYSVFAVSLGIALGTWFRRTMVALGITLALLIAIMLVIVPNFIRPHYETPVSYKMSLLNNSKINGAPTNSNDPTTNGASLIVSQTTVSSQNQPLDWANPPKQCIVTSPPGFGGIPSGHSKAVAAPTGNGTPEAIDSQNGGPAVSLNCLQPLGYRMDVQYQPSYRYWDFQRIETGLYLALSVIPIGATYWLVLRRDA
jgi:ABC-type transport system involved in multi-copper enzyme maturation permease subunit